MRALIPFVLSIGACGGGAEPTSRGAGPTEPLAASGGEEEAAAAPAPAPAAEGGENFTITTRSEGDARVGAEGRVEVQLEGRNGYHVNAEYPIQLTVRPPGGVEVAKTSLAREDASTFGEERAVFPVVFTPREPGRKEFDAELSFSVCNPQSCLLERRPVRFAVQVQ